MTDHIIGESKTEIEGNLEDLKPGEGVEVDDKTKYEFGANLETEGQRVFDPATGQAVILRTFEFAIDPRVQSSKFPKNKQEIFNAHVRLVQSMLWGDGLVPYEDVSPRVVIDLKNRKYKIIVAAIARLGTTIIERPESLSKMLASTATKRGTRRHKE